MWDKTAFPKQYITTQSQERNESIIMIEMLCQPFRKSVNVLTLTKVPSRSTTMRGVLSSFPVSVFPMSYFSITSTVCNPLTKGISRAYGHDSNRNPHPRAGHRLSLSQQPFYHGIHAISLLQCAADHAYRHSGVDCVIHNQYPRFPIQRW